MRLVKRISLFIFMMLFGLNIVKADSSCDMVFTADDSTFFNELGSSVNGFPTAVYTFNSDYGSYKSYCMNPGWPAGKVAGQYTEFNCKRVVLDVTSDSDNQKRHDMGLTYILKTSTLNNKGINDSNRVLAVRIYEMFWKNFNNNGANTSEEYVGYKEAANYFFDMSEIKKALNDLRKKLPEGYLMSAKYANDTGANLSGFDLNLVRDLIVAGLNAANEYNPDIDTSIKYDNPQKTREILETYEDGRKKYLQKETYTLDISYFTKDEGKITINNFNCPSCKEKGVTYKFFINDLEVSEANLKNTNILALPEENNTLVPNADNYLNGQVKFRIEFTGTVKDCADFAYWFTLNYSDPKIIPHDIYQVKATNKGTTQTFYVVSNNNVNVSSVRVNSVLSFCTNSGVSGGGQCDVSLKNLQCNQCDTNGNELVIEEGHRGANSKSCNGSSGKGDIDIKYCIAHDGAEDIAGNSYKSPELDGDRYCGLYCKEDYTIHLPGTQIVQSGRYFSLSAELEGTKTCYASSQDGGAIGSYPGEAGLTRYRAETLATANASISAHNEWNKASAAADKPEDYDYTRKGKTVCTPASVTTECTAYHPIDGYCIATKEVEVPAVYAISSVTVHFKYTAHDLNEPGGNPHTVEGKETRDIEETCDEDVAKSRMHTIMVEEKGEAPTFLNGIQGDDKPGAGGGYMADTGGIAGTGAGAKVGTYGMYTYTYHLNNCSHMATADYTISSALVPDSFMPVDWPGYQPLGGTSKDNQILEYWYDQKQYMGIASTRFLTMNFEETPDDNAKLLYCTGNVSADYETCYTNEGWLDYNPTEHWTVWACYGSGEMDCQPYDLEHSTAWYIKKEMTQTVKFITPTQFYSIFPSGKIAVLDNKEDVLDNGTILENGLPVGLGTKAGAGSFLLMFRNLGEYYRSDKLGRIWGDYNSVVSTALKKSDSCRQDSALKYSDEFDGTVFDGGVYSCEYDVNICDNKNSCKTPDESDDNKWHCKDGDVCDEDEYNKECSNSCKKPNESEDGNWHCEDGDVCTQDEYLKECDPCPDCPVICDEDGCYKEDDSCPNNRCPVECPTCLYNNGSNINYRPVSPDNLNPNDRDLGINWQYDDKINNALELKAYKTSTEIESDGSKIYDTNGDTPRVTFKVNSKMITDIRKYNDEHEDEGYYNNSLECYDYTDADGVVYKNVYCYSTFIDHLIETFPDQVSGFENRIMGDKNVRKSKTQTSGYWTTWAEMRDDAKKWNVTTEEGIESYFSNYKNIGVGPSWK